MNPKLLVGIVGQPLAGKDLAAAGLQVRHGFLEVSSSDRLREHMRSLGLDELDRMKMNVESTRLRHHHGADFLVRWILDEHPDTLRLSISGLRLVEEVNMLRRHGGILIAVGASQEIRFQRLKLRNRPGDDITWEQFLEIERIESDSNDSLKHNVNAVMALADYKIQNDGTVDEFNRAFDALIEQLILKSNAY